MKEFSDISGTVSSRPLDGGRPRLSTRAMNVPTATATRGEMMK
jgi:hypothetical protein